MKTRMGWLALALLAASSVWWLSGCGGTDTSPDIRPGTQKEAGLQHGDHKEGEHQEGHQEEHKHNEHKQGQKDGHTHGDHHAKALTEKDVKLPDSFQAGVTRLEELHGKIDHLIEHNELADVHRVAEEMAIVAKHMKELARQGLPEDKQTEAGRLCNQVAGYFHPIDEAADSGNKAETQAIHQKMKDDLERLKALSK